jgi:hypothetical protein
MLPSDLSRPDDSALAVASLDFEAFDKRKLRLQGLATVAVVVQQGELPTVTVKR